MTIAAASCAPAVSTIVFHTGDANGDPLWWMLGQMLIEVDEENTPDGIWSAPGDSGAVVVNLANDVVAMHWGGDGAGTGYATDIFAITTALTLAMG